MQDQNIVHITVMILQKVRSCQSFQSKFNLTKCYQIILDRVHVQQSEIVDYIHRYNEKLLIFTHVLFANYSFQWNRALAS